MSITMGSLAMRDDWNRHWDDYAASAEHNPAQRYRRKLILSALNLNSAPAPRVLDIGSGQGDFATQVLSTCPAAAVLGLDLSASGVAEASRKVPAANFLQCNLAQPHETPRNYQAWATHAVCSEVLEHMDSPEDLLVRAQAWMAPGCRLIVTVPGGPMSAFDRHIGHRRHYAPEQLGFLLEDSGFHVELATGAGFPFFNLYRRVVIARGSKLIDDACKRPSLGARAAMGLFDALFRLNRYGQGWQTLAVARL